LRAALNRTADRFDAIDQIEVHRKLRVDIRPVVDVLVQPVSIDLNQHAAVVRSWAHEASGRDAAVVSIVGGEESRDASQHLGARAVAMFPNFIASDEGDERRRFGYLLLEFRCAKQSPFVSANAESVR